MGKGTSVYRGAMNANPLKLMVAALLLAAVPPAAQEAAAQEAKVPYWASIRVEEVNMRVGPGESYRILWVYKRQNLPLKVLRLKEGWRLVRDPDGAEGWMLAQFLSRERGAIVSGKGLAEMRESGSDSARLRWRLEPGVTGKLGECAEGWCEFDAAGHKGWVRQERLWGSGEP